MRRLLPTGVILVGLVTAIVSAESRAAPTPAQTTSNGSTRTRPQMEPSPVHIRGAVILENGTHVPPGLRVELLIGGTVVLQDFTSSDGSFVFDFSDSGAGSFADASVSSSLPGENSGGTGRRDGRVASIASTMDGVGGVVWEVRAILPGYVSETASGYSRDSLTVILHPMAQVKATTISLKSLMAPKRAVERYESAQKAMQKKKPDRKKAVTELEKALAEYPDYSAAWQLMGEIRLLQKDNAGARTAFEKALATDDKYTSPYLSLASLDLEENRWAEAADISSKLIGLNPYVTRGHFLNAVANFNLGRFDVAERSITEVQKQDDKRYPLTHYLLGAMAAERGDLNEATVEFRTYLGEQPKSPYTGRVKQALEQWRKQGVAAAAEKKE
jgi:Tfp pilus assembly protein PilF